MSFWIFGFLQKSFRIHFSTSESSFSDHFASDWGHKSWISTSGRPSLANSKFIKTYRKHIQSYKNRNHIHNIYKKICRKSTDRTRKINKKMNKIHTPPSAGWGRFASPLWILYIFLKIFLERSVDFLHIFLYILCIWFLYALIWLYMFSVCFFISFPYNIKLFFQAACKFVELKKKLVFLCEQSWDEPD